MQIDWARHYEWAKERKKTESINKYRENKEHRIQSGKHWRAHQNATK